VVPNVDVAPTLLELAGVSAPEGLHDKSREPNESRRSMTAR
jgi:arylsulfatase A-like enzyme